MFSLTVMADEYVFSFRGHTTTSATTTGRFSYRKEDTNVDTPFLARDMNNNKGSMSDLKKCDIDTQTDYLVDFAYKKAFELISMNSQLFEKLASQLRDERTLTGSIVNEKVEIILNKDIIDLHI